MFKKVAKRVLGFVFAATVAGGSLRDKYTSKLDDPGLLTLAGIALADKAVDAVELFEFYNAEKEAAGDRYSTGRALKRAWRRHTGETPIYTRRGAKQELLTNCLQADDDLHEAPANVATLWRNIRLMKKSPLVGAPIVKYAADNDLFFCHENLDYAGVFYHGRGMMDISNDPRFRPGYLLVTEVHEGQHAVQSANALSTDDFHWSIDDYLMYRLAGEAAAMATEYIYALDMIHEGDKSLEEELRSPEHEGAPRAAAMAYGIARAEGKSHRDALIDAGQAGFEAQFKVQWWLDSYNATSLALHLRETLSYVPGEELPEPSGKSYSVEEIKKEAQVSPDFNFLANLKAAPSYESRFGTNERMRQAFDFAGYLRLKLIEGPRAPAVKDQYAALVKAKNPYIAIKDTKTLYNVVGNYLNNRDFSLLDGFDYIAGIPSQDQKQKPKPPGMK